ncbi:MAG: DnaJ domain-containing protein [Pyrinomonadaceae bacterium]
MTNEPGRERCLEVLGLDPHASAQEIKAAYRDLAKVWHPDRFAHDPRLQQKAQEKLKEINDAYQRLVSGTTAARDKRTPRDTGAARDARAPQDPRHDAPRAARADDADGPPRADAPGARRNKLWLALAPFVVSCATFAFVTPRLLSKHSAPTQGAVSDAARAPRAAPDDAPADAERPPAAEETAQKNARSLRPPDGAARAESSAADKSEEVSPTMPLRALPTVSVLIDPATNLRARADCPHKLTVTFPAGDEPSAYCNAEHKHVEPDAATVAEQGEHKSRLKSLAGRLTSPSKWLNDKPAPDAPVKKPATQDQSRDQD